MMPKWPKLASLGQKICILWYQFFDALFASKHPFKNILKITITPSQKDGRQINNSYCSTYMSANT